MGSRLPAAKDGPGAMTLGQGHAAMGQRTAVAQGGTMVGHGTAPGCQSARCTQHRPPQAQPNRVCGGLFLTNIEPMTTQLQLQFIKREA